MCLQHVQAALAGLSFKYSPATQQETLQRPASSCPLPACDSHCRQHSLSSPPAPGPPKGTRVPQGLELTLSPSLPQMLMPGPSF